MGRRASPLESLVTRHMMTFWHRKKVFLTGHTGFKGSWLSLWLQSLGANVTGYALPPPTTPNLFTLANVADGMQSVIGDVRDYDALKNTMQAHKPEIVIHMAAQPLVRYSYKEPVETFATNVMGTVHVLEAARHIDSVKTIINVTTDKCYENDESNRGYHENDRLGGHDPYSSSKACSELVTSSYRDAYFQQGPALASARAGNVIGGGDWAADRLIPDIINSCLQSRPVLIRHPHALRPWQHVLEPLSGYLLLAQRLHESPTEYAESWNFGPLPDDIQPVSWIADRITQLWGHSASWKLDGGNHPHEATYLRLDCTKAASKLGWQPRWNITKGLEETVHWYRAYHQNQPVRDITLAQIQQFMNQK